MTPVVCAEESLDQGNPDAVRSRFEQHHGNLRSIAKTELQSSRSGLIIISTVVLGTGHSLTDGFFGIYETRVFGGSGSDIVTRVNINDDTLVCVQRLINEHLETVRKTSTALIESAR